MTNKNEIVNFSDIRLSPRRPAPVYLLLDTSGSMAGEKINELNAGFAGLISNCKKEDNQEIELVFTVITFGGGVHIPIDNMALKEINIPTFSASGDTPMGAALELVAGKLDEFYAKNAQSYRPIIVLFSDGEPTDMPSGLQKCEDRKMFWEKWISLQKFHAHRRVARATRLACAFGQNANKEMLVAFANADEKTHFQVLMASDAAGIAKFFKYVTASIATHTTSTDSEDWSQMAPLKELYFLKKNQCLPRN